MKLRFSSAVALIVVMIFSMNMVGPANAAEPGVTLPSTPVTIEVFNGTSSFFETLLSNVPSGYDVENRAYLGWCVDRRHLMPLAPATHQVTLFSSYNPPSDLVGEKWDMVNYILNHKPQHGTAMDIQEAVWYFIHLTSGYSPPLEDTIAWTLINDTKENGIGFVPILGQAIGVICYTAVTGTQISIIEAECTAVIPELPSILVLSSFMAVLLLFVTAWKKLKPRLVSANPQCTR